MEDNTQSQNANIKSAIAKIWSKRWTIIRNCTMAFIMACLWIFPQPRNYEASVILAPEMGSSTSTSSSLSSLAASFGISLGKNKAMDAIYPTLYPNVMESKDFIVGLMSVDVTTSDRDEPITTSYYDYLIHHQKYSIWSKPFRWINKSIGNLIKKAKGEEIEESDFADVTTIDPFRLTNKQERLIKSIQKRIRCEIDDKTFIILLSVTDQDPLVSATLADSAQVRLQRFITNYKTKKARIDMDYYANLCEQSRNEYEEALKEYSLFQDSHVNATLQSTISQGEHMRNDVQIKQTTYSTFMTQYEAAKAKVQEETPSFTILQSPSVPTVASAPRRAKFVVIITALAGILTLIYYFRCELGCLLANTFREKEDVDEDDDY